MQEQGPQYVGFWARSGAAMIDTLLVGLLIFPILIAIGGWPQLPENWDELLQARDMQELMEILAQADSETAEPAGLGGTFDFLVTWILPAIAVVVFWVVKQATPGKMVFSAVIVDATSGAAPRSGQLIGRYIAYFIALVPFGLGILWICFDKRKQGWHDKLAGTVVVRKQK